jgi:hypothetical protein
MEVNPISDIASIVAASQAAKNTENRSEVSIPKQDAAAPETSKDVDSFIAFLKKSLGKSGPAEVHEEELYSSLIALRLEKESPEALAHYQKMVVEYSSSMARADGWVPMEDVAKLALKSVVAEGMVTNEKAEMINAEAFQGAQLDANMEMLFDGRGDTKAVMGADEAMFKVKEFLAKVDSGEIKITGLSLDTPSNQGHVSGKEIMSGKGVEGLDGVEGPMSAKQIRFTWKHESDRDGNLAILLPTMLNGLVRSVKIYSEDGELIETGDYSKQTGDSRAVYRFNKPGGEYGRNVDVVVTKKNGEELVYRVKNGGERTYVAQNDYKVGYNENSAMASSGVSSSPIPVSSSSASSSSSEDSVTSASSSSSSDSGSVPPPSAMIGNPAVM